MRSERNAASLVIFVLLLLAISPQVSFAISFDLALETSQSVDPPILNGATPSGTATVNVNTLTGAVSITGDYTGMTSNVDAAHLHGLAAPGAVAGVLVPLPTTAGFTGTFSGGDTLSGGNLAGLLAGETYINIHTGQNLGGELRGQVIDTDIRVLDITLGPGQSVPSPSLGGFTTSGSARIVVDTSSGDVEVTGSYVGMTSNVTDAHLHGLAPPGFTAGVIIPFDVTGGDAGMFSGIGVLTEQELAGLLAGETYINVHTSNNGPGEIRAQVIPEPGTGLLLALGFAGLALAGRARTAEASQPGS